jgi:hypothetical protein
MSLNSQRLALRERQLITLTLVLYIGLAGAGLAAM